MNSRKTACEIGLFETAGNIAQILNRPAAAAKAGASMPLPAADIKSRIHQTAVRLLGLRKKKYMFLTPEIAVLEEMAALSPNSCLEAILALPCDMDPQSRERLKNNLPCGIEVEILDEPYFPNAFFPGNGAIVICGYTGGDRLMVLSSTYRMAEHYSGFLGKKIFVPYAEFDISVPCEGWMELNPLILTEEWRIENET